MKKRMSMWALREALKYGKRKLKNAEANVDIARSDLDEAMSDLAEAQKFYCAMLDTAKKRGVKTPK